MRTGSAMRAQVVALSTISARLKGHPRAQVRIRQQQRLALNVFASLETFDRASCACGVTLVKALSNALGWR